MVQALKTSFIYLFCTLLVAVITVFGIEQISARTNTPTDLTQVSKDTVSVTSKVTGFVEAKQTADLAFPMAGTIKELFKQEGEEVSSNEIIASLIQDSLLAEYEAARHNLEYLNSVKQELLRGPQAEARTVTDTNVQIAKDALKRTKAEHTQLVQNAYRKLLSSNIEAIPTNLDSDDTPPTITGTYHCADEGTYTLSLFRSRSPSGYSYRLSGLETGTYTGWVDAPSPLGSCGLLIQFDADEQYHNGDWTISIPNKRGSSYVTNINAYQLALEQEKKAVAAAELAVELAEDTAHYSNADPTTESLSQINAQIREASAAMSVHEARIENYVIRSPFDGIVARIDMEQGEAADLTKTVSVISEEAYTLKARIPEIDIRDITVGDRAEVTFDASPKELFAATIEYISPRSTDIDGVAYYEARLLLDNEPVWMREGLNTDIEIIIARKADALVIPKQYVEFSDGRSYVYVAADNVTSRVPVETGLIGNDGYVEVTNLPEGTSVSLP